MLYQDSASNAKMGYSVQVLDLFSGIGGFSLGLKRAGMETIGFCEIDPFCRKVLTKHWPDVPIHTDIRGLDGKDYKGRAEIICGVFRASPSLKQGSEEAQKMTVTSGLRCLESFRRSGPLGLLERTLLGSSKWNSTRCFLIWKEGYQTRAFIIPACGVDAPHKEIGSGLLHTPTAKGNQMAPSMKDRDPGSWNLWPTPSANEDAAGTPNGKMQKCWATIQM